MIKCNLSTLMGKRRLKISDVARDTDIHRNVITHYYKDNISSYDKKVLDALCKYFNCKLSDLIEFISD